jgi:putative nucleotidyltransferase with HDIG domain
LFLHSIAVALASQFLARPLKLQQAGMVFTAGLLHDVGKVVLNEFVAEDYIEIARRVAQDHISFSEAEEQVIGFSHQEVGAQLAERWSLPKGIVDCIRYHHAPLALERHDPYVDAVHIADSICILLGIGAGDDGLSYRACPTVMSRNGLTEADVEAIGVEVVAEVKSVQAMLASK